MSDTGVSGARLSRLRSTADRRAEAWPLLPGPAGAPSPTKRDGVGAPRLGHGAQRRAGCWGCLPGDAPASRDLRPAQAPRLPTPPHPSAGGGRATSRRRPKARKRLAPQGGRGPTPRTARSAWPEPSAVSAQPIPRWPMAAQRVAWRQCAMPHAQGKNEVRAQDITGVAWGGATKRSFSAATGHATCNSPLC